MVNNLEAKEIINLFNALINNDKEKLDMYGLSNFKEKNSLYYQKIIELIGNNRILDYIVTINDPYIFEYIEPIEQPRILRELLDSDNTENEKGKSIIKIIWRECALEVKENCDLDVYSKLIETMQSDTKGLATIWGLTPESLQLKNSNLLEKILEYSIDDTKRYLSIWQNTSDEVKKQYPHISQKINILEQLKTVNQTVESTISLKMLDDKYTSTLRFEQLQIITNYPTEQKKILGLTDAQYNVMCNALSSIDDIQQWRYEYNSILLNIDSYESLIDDIAKMPIEDVDYHKVLKALHQENYFNLQNYQDLEKLDETKASLYQDVREDKSNSSYDKRLILLEYLFSIDVKHAQNLIKKYASDFAELTSNEENDKLKNIINQMQTIVMSKDEQEIIKLFNRPDFKRIQINGIEIEQNLKKAYANEYNSKLTQLKSMDTADESQINKLGLQGFSVYDAGLCFNMMITSIAPYNSNFPKNFYEDWNRKETASQGFCCSYIRNDMLGHAPVPHICYGFSNMSAESLMLSSVDDMGSNTSNGVVEKVAYNNVKFYSPDHQINAVYDESQYGFNEMVYNRMQDGKKKQPDYIVAFMRDGNIPNIETIKQVVNQYRENGIELPIVIIDEDKCIANEKKELGEMIHRFEINPSLELFTKIQQKAKNNSVANQMDFMEYSNYIFNDYQNMVERIAKLRQNNNPQNDVRSFWMEKCKHWYELPSKLPEESKNKFFELKRKATQFIKSKLIKREQNKEKDVGDKQRDE